MHHRLIPPDVSPGRGQRKNSCRFVGSGGGRHPKDEKKQMVNVSTSNGVRCHFYGSVEPFHAFMIYEAICSSVYLPMEVI
jgi:hypothetical protein